MPQLVILLPLRPRDGAPADAAVAGPAGAAEYAWALSADGLSLTRHGRSAPADLPAADSVVAVLAAPDVAWHHPKLPKAPAARLRAALGGLLEDQLLEDDETVHLAVAPGASAGAPAWVAALNKPWLQAQLATLAAAGRVVGRVVPAHWPREAEAATDGADSTDTAPPQAHVFAAHVFAAQAYAADGLAADAAPATLAGTGVATPETLAWLACHEAGTPLCLPLAGSLANAWLTQARTRGLQLSATPAAVTLAEHALAQAGGGGAPAVAVLSEAEQALAALRSGWQLLQFDLAPRHRGLRAAGELWQLWRGPAWRPARLGLAALLGVQLLGLNAWAWQQRQALAEQRASADSLLRSAHPQVRAILDAPVQMRRETELLRERAGVAGDGDLETLLAATAAAWPDGAAPASQLRFEPGRLSLAAPGLAPPQLAQLRQRLQLTGWTVEPLEGRLVVQRGRVGAPATTDATTEAAAAEAAAPGARP
ncbi:type II secretion system protein GspL [Aquabacterium sp. OR-4]|uniref:type II secretion system protein GspL n=1 Tax=Aquabacterium sp. OR-4 TaxID=2978127 RepID=UPI0028C6D64A|nr:type II secretion system protein GspL [Aquabacterium sp. OR-4]MDT7837596.1 type II secretion system protein GspL [Aquabacterium sp. OR-4]